MASLLQRLTRVRLCNPEKAWRHVEPFGSVVLLVAGRIDHVEQRPVAVLRDAVCVHIGVAYR